MWSSLWLAAVALPRIVIDPGHGGGQSGASGVCGVNEDDVTLAVAQRTRALLEVSGQASVLLTRTGDVEVALEARPSFANLYGAALFVSVHANSSPRPESSGFETFVLAPDTADRRIAQLLRNENGGRMPAVGSIVDSLRLEQVHRESRRVADFFQKALARELEAPDRGVLQAPFMVLAAAKVPAVLVEVGFLSNPGECANLANAAYQQRVAKALAAATLRYLAERDWQQARLGLAHQ